MTFSLPDSGKKILAKKWVLGFNLSNNGSVCLLRYGKLIFYLESERVTRKKWDHRIDSLLERLPTGVYDVALTDSHWTLSEKRLDNIKDIQKIKKKYPKAKIYDYRSMHHLTHAACAFYNSGFSEASCIVVDSNGSKTSEGLEIETIFNAPSFTEIHKRYFSPDFVGFGRIFEETARTYGWDYRDAGKVMGKSASGHAPAYTVQKKFEQRYSELIEMTTGNICLSGGCFLNCVANYKMKKKYPHINFYIEPIAHDGGTAIGAAYLAYNET